MVNGKTMCMAVNNIRGGAGSVVLFGHGILF